jgi:hypothetical protein
MPSFDTVCEADVVEVKNGVENTAKEITTRFDFKGTSAAIEFKDKEITLIGDSDFQLAQIDDILRTANTWKGPIGKFKLTTDKGNPCNILSLCATDIEKTGPTTFVIEKTDYTPPEDFSILIATPEMVVLS